MKDLILYTVDDQSIFMYFNNLYIFLCLHPSYTILNYSASPQVISTGSLEFIYFMKPNFMSIFRETELDKTEGNKILPYRKGAMFIQLMPDMIVDMMCRQKA